MFSKWKLIHKCQMFPNVPFSPFMRTLISDHCHLWGFSSSLSVILWKHTFSEDSLCFKSSICCWRSWRWVRHCSRCQECKLLLRLYYRPFTNESVSLYLPPLQTPHPPVSQSASCLSPILPLNVCSVTQLCPTLCDLMDCSLPGSSVHGILQTRTLEWIAISSSRGSSRPRDQACVSGISCIGRQVFYHCATCEVPIQHLILVKRSSVYYCLLFTTL